MSNLVYCIVADGMIYSNRIDRKAPRGLPNGVYSIDMEQDDFMDSIAPADVSEATKAFRKASKMQVLRGISFHDCFVPENPVKYPQLPIKVKDATYDEFEEVEVVIAREKVCYFLQTLSTSKAYLLMDLAEISEKGNSEALKKLTGITPEMRIVYAYHLMERRKKEEIEPVNAIKIQMEQAGANVSNVKKNNRGYDVTWSWDGVTVITQLDKKFRVVHAGYCVSGYDDTQSARSVVNLMQTYRKEGSYIVVTRAPR
jgi:hypothetical protein